MREHPGYWWLSYGWSNCRPRARIAIVVALHEDSLAGKADFFDVKGVRAVLPGDDLTKEQALLLDPTGPGFRPGQSLRVSRRR